MIKKILIFLKLWIIKLRINIHEIKSKRSERELVKEFELINIHINTAIANIDAESILRAQNRLIVLMQQTNIEIEWSNDIKSAVDNIWNEFEQKIIIPAKRDRLKPPSGAERLLALMLTPDRLEEVLGDSEEGYRKLAERHGLTYARNWYRWQVAMVAIHGAAKLAWRAAKAWFWFGGGGFGSA